MAAVPRTVVRELCYRGADGNAHAEALGASIGDYALDSCIIAGTVVVAGLRLLFPVVVDVAMSCIDW
jgi:hypothetical protein